MEELLQLNLKLSSLNSLFEVFTPIGFALFAIKGAQSFIGHFNFKVTEILNNFDSPLKSLETLMLRLKEYQNSRPATKSQPLQDRDTNRSESDEDKNDEDPLTILSALETKIEAEDESQPQDMRKIMGIQVTLKDNRNELNKKEETVLSASRMDFLQMGMFSLIMLILCSVEDYLFLPKDNAVFGFNLVLGLSCISLSLFIYRHLTFDFTGYEEVPGDTVILFNNILSKIVVIALLLLAYAGLAFLGGQWFRVHIVFIFFFSFLNLIAPFYYMYRRRIKLRESVLDSSDTIFQNLPDITKKANSLISKIDAFLIGSNHSATVS